MLYYVIHACSLRIIAQRHKSLSIMKKPKKKSLGLDREHKDITCAVRVPQTMYKQLCKVAKAENSSISDVIRTALTYKITDFAEKEMERRLKTARLEVELRKLESS